jgi:hypothetical protein
LPGVGERIQLRRRLREQRRAREAMLLDLGALVYELHRQGRRAPELLQQKAAELEVVDGEVRELEDRLAGIAPEDEHGWAEGEVPEDALHEDFDDLDEEEPEPGEYEPHAGEEGEFEEEFEEDEFEDELDRDEPEAEELPDEPEEDEYEDDLYEEERDDRELADDPLDEGADADATVEVDALDGLPDDREARS